MASVHSRRSRSPRADTQSSSTTKEPFYHGLPLLLLHLQGITTTPDYLSLLIGGNKSCGTPVASHSFPWPARATFSRRVLSHHCRLVSTEGCPFHYVSIYRDTHFILLGINKTWVCSSLYLLWANTLSFPFSRRWHQFFSMPIINRSACVGLLCYPM